MEPVQRIIVDADACPRNALAAVARAVKRRALRLVTVASHNHAIRVDELDGTQHEHIMVDARSQAADLAIGNRADAGDLVVTQDWGLAALALAKGARAVSPRGLIFSPDNIDGLLAMRHAAARARRSGIHKGGPSARTAADDTSFVAALNRLLNGCDLDDQEA